MLAKNQINRNKMYNKAKTDKNNIGFCHLYKTTTSMDISSIYSNQTFVTLSFIDICVERG